MLNSKEAQNKRLKLIWAGIFALILIGVNIFIFFMTRHWAMKNILAVIMGNILMVISASYLVFIYRTAKAVEGMAEEGLNSFYKRSSWILAGLLFVLPFFFIIWVPDSAHNWDFFQLYRNITTLKGASFSHLPFTQGYGDLSGLQYYLTYANQQFYAIILNRVFGPMTDFFPPIWAMTAVGAALTSASVLAMSNIVKTISEKKYALLFNVAAFGFWPFIIFGAQLYTDTASLPFVVFGLLFMVWALRAESLPKQILFWLLALVFIFVGYVIKPTVAIVLVAALIYLLLNKKWKQLLIVLPLLVVTFFATNSMAKAVIHSEPAFTETANARYNLPLLHWVTMSFAPDNKTGGYNHAVLEYSMSFEDKTARQTADRELLIDNLKQEGIGGFLRQLGRKIVYTWFNGDLNDFFYTYRHANPLINYFFDYTTWEPNPHVGNITGWLFTRTAQMLYWLALVPLMWYEIGLSLWRKRKTEWFILGLAVVGLAGFLLIWEANSRYLYNFTPIMVALASMGLVDFLKGRRAKKQEKEGASHANGKTR
ncbi:glycosyltransferase family 39 protein [Lactococcus termiticola]|uniref:Uncharacterized protein n=1 Tax=Lactococcus termiticola TaxID=2169526 RepID=A0A2R5HJF5_9LACT|nr:glycosyltransferase family 39 protein [Lactococcus termiticola]GBG96710.1 hypothetical protein NtB2_00834 [Lactococcus termiticola]